MWSCHRFLLTDPCLQMSGREVWKYSADAQMQIIDRLSNPNSERELRCREIASHTRLCGGADGNCLFCAFSRQLTGTEDNHEAIRQALVAYLCLHPDYIRMERPAVDREVPRDYVQRYVFRCQRVDNFLEERANDERYGRWGTDLDICDPLSENRPSGVVLQFLLRV